MTDEFDDDEAAVFFEGEERLEAIRKVRACSSAGVREAALAYLMEEHVLAPQDLEKIDVWWKRWIARRLKGPVL